MKQITELLNATARLYDKVASSKLVGKSEKKLKRLIFFEYRTSLKDFSFKGDVVAGSRSAIGDGDATDYVIRQGDMIILDLLPMKMACVRM